MAWIKEELVELIDYFEYNMEISETEPAPFPDIRPRRTLKYTNINS